MKAFGKLVIVGFVLSFVFNNMMAAHFDFEWSIVASGNLIIGMLFGAAFVFDSHVTYRRKPR